MFKYLIVTGLIIFQINGYIIATSEKIETNINENIYVDDDNTEGPWEGTIEHPFCYISTALDAVDDKDADTIFIFNGTYIFNQHYFHYINFPINIIGEDKNNTIIDGDGWIAFLVESSDVKISGLTIKNSYYGIYVRNAPYSSTITDNIIYNCSRNAIRVTTSNETIISKNLIKDNNKSGICLSWQANYCHVSENIVKENKGAGILLESANHNTIENNYVYDNFLQGIFLENVEYGPENNIILNNTVEKNSNGIELKDGTRNTITKNRIINNSQYGIKMFRSSLNKVKNNDIMNNKGIGIVITSSYSVWNIVSQNNFINNSENAYFSGTTKIIYLNNYWDHPRLRPYLIKGEKGSRLFSSRIKIDWRPALKPFDI